MITATELRTGNILQYFIEDEGKWHYTTLDWHDIKWCHVNQVNFNKLHVPVQLTAEVLEQCGFEKVKYGGIDLGWYKINGISKYGRWIKTEGILLEVDLPQPFLRYDGLVDIYYLHHLQNLFYSLTGEELNFLPS